MMRLDLATAEYIGARAQQQDLAAALPFSSGAVLVLADGLGGHESGADASRIVVETFREACTSGRFVNPATRRQALKETVDRANARIAEGVNPAHGHRGMASTVVAAVIAQGELSWVSVGDSHLYVWRGGRLRKLNEDHSQAGLMVRSGQYQPNDPEVQAVKSVLVSALTGRKLEIVDLPQKGFKIEPGDVLMLASDGLNTLPDDEIEDIVAEVRAQGAVKLSTTLLERVRSRRLERQDNTTVAIARVLESPRPEAAEPARRPLMTDPQRKLNPETPQRPAAAQTLSLDEASEARTERITPIPSEPERPPPAPRPMPAAAASAEPPKPTTTPRPVPQAAAPPPQPREPQAQPEAAQGHVATAQAAMTEAAASSLGPAPQPPDHGKPATPPVNRARISQPRLPNAADKRKPATLGETAAAELPRAPSATEARWDSEGRSSRSARPMRVLLGVLLLVLIAIGVAIAAFAALAALKPQWLSGIVPGFGAIQATAPQPERTEPAAAPTEVAPQPVLAPVPAPVPAVRPAQEPATRRDGPEATRAPAAVVPNAQPKAPPTAPQADEPAKAAPADPAAIRSAPVAPAAAPAAAPATPVAVPSPPQPQALPAEAAAPQATPQQAGDPPLIEPPRPARPPATPPPARPKRNPPAN